MQFFCTGCGREIERPFEEYVEVSGIFEGEETYIHAEYACAERLLKEYPYECLEAEAIREEVVRRILEGV